MIEEAKEVLKKYNQNKVIKILEKLDKETGENLAKQILNTNLEEIFVLYNRINKNVYGTNLKVEPIEFVDKNNINQEEFENVGEEIIKKNQYAVVTMAGGQGTRLGWKGPKGTFKLDIGENGKYIFEIFVDKLKRAKEQYGVEVFWYIMTSIENNKDTVDFFEEHNYFGYNKEKVKFFNQSVLPLLDSDGNLLIDKNFNLRKASDGNGSVFKSLRESGMIGDMKKRGIKWVYICGVDNIMANMVDSTFLGLTIKNDMPAASKSVKKAYPEERVGVFCRINGSPSVIEYSEMSDDLIYAKDDNGALLYGEANFVSHLFKLEALEKLANIKLEYHLAFKKNAYIDENLNEVVPEHPNSYKFEAFIFDGFKALDDMLIMRVNRDEEFAPIKNATGVDSPETAKAIYEKNMKGC